MRVLDLFAGIGGFSLAAHWMGWETVAFVERDKFCQKVLRKNFGQDIEIHDDILTFSGKPFRGRVDIITGGFPCQPFSAAGKRKGRDDERHLFPEMLRVISEVRPRWVVAENVRGLLSIESGSVFSEVITSLEGEGYEVITFCVPASAVEAPHRRDRLWFVAHSNSNGDEPRRNTRTDSTAATEIRRISTGNVLAGLVQPTSNTGDAGRAEHWSIKGSGFEESGEQAAVRFGDRDSPATDAAASGLPFTGLEPRQQAPDAGNGTQYGDRDDSNAAGSRLQGSGQSDRHDGSSLRNGVSEPAGVSNDELTNPGRSGLQGRMFQDGGEGSQSDDEQSIGCGGGWGESWIQAATRFCRVDDVVPNRVDRLKSLGNSIVPVIAYEIFKAIDEATN